jgi:hypothetical protein
MFLALVMLFGVVSAFGVSACDRGRILCRI